MYNIIPLILILISLTIIIIIIKNKFPALANINLESIQTEKEAKLKEQIISSRFKRNIIKWNSKFTKIIEFFRIWSNNLFQFIYNKLQKLKNSYKTTNYLTTEDKKNIIQKLLEEIELLDQKNNFNEIEEKLIQIISFDNKNLKAFMILGSLYFENKKFEEGKQIFQYTLKLIENNIELKDEAAEIYFNLALIYQSIEQFDKAILNFQEALKIEPNNPRFLHNMLEMSILKKDKILAKEIYFKLMQTNPDNQKLKELVYKIENL